MKKALALILAVVMCLSLFAACGESSSSQPATTAPGTTAAGETTTAEAKPVELKVVTEFGGEDSHVDVYKKWNQKFIDETGNTIKDNSAYADDNWKIQVTADFNSGNIPDVLFFFNGATAEDIIKTGKVVDLATVQAEFPDYAKNIGEGALKTASNIASDGKIYSVPIKGFAEGLYCNKQLFADNGLTYPKTWDEFMNCIAKFNEAGITPISVSIGAEPHYWFEHLLLATGGTDALAKNITNEADVPASWTAGFDLFKTLYDANAFPKNTASMKGGDEANALFKQGKAAMYLDGSWFNGQIPTEKKDGLVSQDEIDVVAFPTVDPAYYGNIVAGFSSGWYITTEAWNDPDKKAVAMKYLMMQTSNEAIADYCGPGIGGIAAAEVKLEAGAGHLAESMSAMTGASTGSVGAMQDAMTQAARSYFIANLINLSEGKMTTADFIKGLVEANNVADTTAAETEAAE